MPQEKLVALLVSDGDETLENLRHLLKNAGVDVWCSQSCEEVASLLDQTHPRLVFTATTLSDGIWSDVVSLTEKASLPTNVIVVGRHKDIDLYLSTMDRGAFDFILPPFEADPIAHVVRVAAENVRRRREEQAIGAVA